MEKAIRIQCFQNLANYRKPSSFIIKETFPLPPYSTVLGMIHAACGYTTFHPMKLSIQGINKGTISELYTRYSFSAGVKYEEGRHQICIEDGEKYGIFKGIANVELVCENQMVIHVVPEEADFETVAQSLKYPKKYLSLGRYEDILDIEKVDIVNIRMEKGAIARRNMYIPVDMKTSWGENLIGESHTTVYNLTKEFEITKEGLRRWKNDNGRVRVYYYPAGRAVDESYVDDMEDNAAIIFA